MWPCFAQSYAGFQGQVEGGKKRIGLTKSGKVGQSHYDPYRRQQAPGGFAQAGQGRGCPGGYDHGRTHRFAYPQKGGADDSPPGAEGPETGRGRPAGAGWAGFFPDFG